MAKVNIRLAFCKTGRAVFISHLSLMRVFQRAFYRARLPLRYTEGFNPHAYISIALPLPLGMESLCERVDFGVAGSVDIEGLPALLNRMLPEGIEVTGAEIAARPFLDICFAELEFMADTVCGAERLRELFEGPLVVEKRSKKGTAKVDIVPLIASIEFEDKGGGMAAGWAVVRAQNPTLNPELLEKAVREYADPDAEFAFRRTRVLDANGEPFDAI